MARKLTAEIPQLGIPDDVVRRVETDADAGVEIAAELVDQIRESGAFDGVHLVPVSRYRQMATRLAHG